MFIHFKSKVCVDGPTEVCNPPICADGPRTILNPGMANDFMSGQGAVPIGPRILGNEGNAGLTKAGFDIVEFDGQNSTFVDWKSIMNDPFNLDLIANAKRTRRFLKSKTTLLRPKRFERRSENSCERFTSLSILRSIPFYRFF